MTSTFKDKWYIWLPVCLVIGVALGWWLSSLFSEPNQVIIKPDDTEERLKIHEEYIKREDEIRNEFDEKLNEIEERFHEVPTKEELTDSLDNLLDISRERECNSTE